MSEQQKGREAPAENAPALPSAAEQLGEITVEIDTSPLTMGDMKLIARIRKGAAGGVSDEEAYALLDKVVVGGYDHLPADAAQQIWTALWTALYGKGRRKN